MVGSGGLLPTFFLIGAGKAGTSSLNEYLSAHPEIHMARVKEPHFFVAEPGPAPFFAPPRVAERRAYEALFECDLRVRGEASHHYTSFPVVTQVPERIHRSVPGARLIYLVRDPIERIESAYVQDSTYRAAGQVERRTFAAALGDLSSPRNLLVAKSRYMTQIRQYLERFDPAQIMVVDAADLRDDRIATLSEIFRFLEVDPDFRSPSFGKEHNKGAAKRRVPGWYAAVDRSLLSRVLGPRVRMAAGRVTSSFGSRIERPVWSDAARDTIEALLAPEVADLRDFTGQRFSTWSL